MRKIVIAGLVGAAASLVLFFVVPKFFGSSEEQKTKTAEEKLVEYLQTEMKALQKDRDGLSQQLTAAGTVNQLQGKLVNVETEFKELILRLKKNDEESTREKEESIRRKGELDQREATVKERERKQEEWKNEVSRNLETEIKKIEEERKRADAKVEQALEAFKKASEELARLSSETSSIANRDAIRKKQVTVVNRRTDLDLVMRQAQVVYNTQIARFRSLMPR